MSRSVGRDNLYGLRRYEAKQRQYKAFRLAAKRPKPGYERRLKAEEYEEYIDKFLKLKSEDDIPNEAQAKIAVKMHDQKKKYEGKNEDDISIAVIKRYSKTDKT